MSGNEDKDLQLSNIKLISVTLFKYHFDIFSGKDFKDEQYAKTFFIFITLCNIQFEISGRAINFEHSKKIPSIFITLFVFQLFNLGNEVSKEHLPNK